MVIEVRARFFCTACKMGRELGPCDFSFPIRTCNNITPPPACPYLFAHAKWKGEYVTTIKEPVEKQDRNDGYAEPGDPEDGPGQRKKGVRRE